MANNKNNFTFELFEYIQSQLKLILSFIIITNFIIIFLLKFSINLKNKLYAFFDVKNFEEKNKNSDSLKNNEVKEITNSEPNSNPKAKLTSKQKDVLLVIAHPDDEIMFFSPTIKVLLNNKIKIQVLCLSNGDYDGIGNIRTEEFQRMCKELKIEDSLILNDDKLRDNLYAKWDPEYIKSILTTYFSKDDNYDKIGTIITFDENGVTKHPNHISCNEGVM